MEQKKLKAELARGELRNFYLLFGEERFLVAHYAAEIEATCAAASKNIFDGAAAAAEIIMAAETVSFDAGKRVILVRDSKLFAAGRKEDSEKIADYLPKIPEDTVLIFAESETDRRTRSFKKAQELGGAFECAPLSPHDLAKWLISVAKKSGAKLEPPAANLLIRTCGTGMFNLENELRKLIAYCGEITPQAIAEISTPTLESRIFDLTKAMGAGRISDALRVYRDMLFLKESPIMILTMVIRQLRIILLCKCHAEKGTHIAQIARELNLRDFMVDEALRHGRRFTTAQLIAALESCQETDLRVKTGLIAPEIGVEMLLVSLA